MAIKSNRIDPLTPDAPIVDPVTGKPTPYFMRQWVAQKKFNEAGLFVPTTRKILTGAGLTGGGDLTADRTLSLNLPNTGPGVGTYGDATHVPQITLDAAGRITAASNVAITGSGGGGFSELVPGGFTLTPVAAASWSNTRNASSTTSSVTDLAGSRGVAFKVPIDTTATLLNNFWKAPNVPPAAGTDFSYKVLLHVTSNAVIPGAWFYGLYLADNSGTRKYVCWGVRNTTLQRFDFNAGITGNPSTTSAGSVGGTGNLYTVMRPQWLQIARVGTNFNFSYSYDGETFIAVDTTTTTAILTSTLTEFGVYMAPNQATPSDDTKILRANCYHVTGP